MAGNARRDERLIALLAAGSTFVAAARAVGMHERSVRKKWAEPAFRQRVEETQRELFDRVLARMVGLGDRGMDTLASLLSSESDNVRLGAVRLLVETGIKRREGVELEARLAELEALAAEMEERL